MIYSYVSFMEGRGLVVLKSCFLLLNFGLTLMIPNRKKQILYPRNEASHSKKNQKAFFEVHVPFAKLGYMNI